MDTILILREINALPTNVSILLNVFFFFFFYVAKKKIIRVAVVCFYIRVCFTMYCGVSCTMRIQLIVFENLVSIMFTDYGNVKTSVNEACLNTIRRLCEILVSVMRIIVTKQNSFNVSYCQFSRANSDQTAVSRVVDFVWFFFFFFTVILIIFYFIFFSAYLRILSLRIKTNLYY